MLLLPSLPRISLCRISAMTQRFFHLPSTLKSTLSSGRSPSTLAVTFSRAWKFCFGPRCLIAPAYSLKVLNHGVLYVTTGAQWCELKRSWFAVERSWVLEAGRGGRLLWTGPWVLHPSAPLSASVADSSLPPWAESLALGSYSLVGEASYEYFSFFFF